MSIVFLDTETTGLDPTKHELVEVAWAVNDDNVKSLRLKHDWRTGDPEAFSINGYFARRLFTGPFASDAELAELWDDLRDNTIVGANPSFDTGFLNAYARTTEFLDVNPWHYRLVDIETYAMAVFDWDKPCGLKAISAHIAETVGLVAVPDHTAASDVFATRALFNALRRLRSDS